MASASGCSGLHFEAIIDPVFANFFPYSFSELSAGVHDLAAAVIDITPVSVDPIGIIVKLVDSDGVTYRSTDIVLYEHGSSYDTNTLEVPCWIGCVDPSPVYFTGFVP